MTPHRLLATVSAAQLASGIAGAILAVRRRHPYDLPAASGSPDTVVRDALFLGTALSAPAPMLSAQAVLTAVVARRPSPRAQQALGWLGAAMLAGYLAERLVRKRLRPSEWDPLETPIVLCGAGQAAAMAVLGLRSSCRSSPPVGYERLREH